MCKIRKDAPDRERGVARKTSSFTYRQLSVDGVGARMITSTYPSGSSSSSICGYTASPNSSSTIAGSTIPGRQ